MTHKQIYMGSKEAFDFIQQIEVSVRTGNVLQALDVKSMEEFRTLTKERVMATKNAGVRTWKEIAELQHTLSPEGLVMDYETKAKELCTMLNDTMNRMSALTDTYRLDVDPNGYLSIYRRITV